MLTATALISERHARITWAPRMARALAVAYPMPEFPPVITTTFPLMSTLCGGAEVLARDPLIETPYFSVLVVAFYYCAPSSSVASAAASMQAARDLQLRPLILRMVPVTFDPGCPCF